MSVLPDWTLSARLEADMLEFCLGDGRRLACRSRRPAAFLQMPADNWSARWWLGPELADRLEQSEHRVLNLQLEVELDAIAWEDIEIGGERLAERFAFVRQLVSSSDGPVEPPPPLSDALSVTIVYPAQIASQVRSRYGQWHCIDSSTLNQASAREALMQAQVLVLHPLHLAALVEQGLAPQRPCLLVLLREGVQSFAKAVQAASPPPPLARIPAVLRALDAGAAVCSLPLSLESDGHALPALLHQLGEGASVGDAVWALHKRQGASRFDLRLYGQEGLRFVQAQAPSSRRQVTCLSFDIAASTELMHRLGDEAYAEMLERLHGRCNDLVRRLGGSPDDPQGDDGIMCYFGHPKALEDAAVRAVEAGLLIHQSVAELGVSVRVGIATGLVAIKANQPVGLAIHLAARLQQRARPGSVLVSASTQGLVAHAFELQVLHMGAALKGITELQEIYGVLRPQLEVAEAWSDRRAWLTPLIGRQAEIERLDQAWQHASRGMRCLAVLRAEAGMGKSRLSREFRHRLVQQGVKVLECRCRSDASASPYLVLAEALRRWLNIGPQEVGTDALKKLAAALPKQARQAESLAQVAALLGLAPLPAARSSAASRSRLTDLLLDWFASIAQGSPSCLIVEDWHWVDPSMGDFVERLAQAKVGPGLLVLVTIRGEAAAAPASFQHVWPIELLGLSASDSRELVSRVCEADPLPAGVVRALAARGDGVPLFLEEAARMVLHQARGLVDANQLPEAAVPASLQDLLMARLDALGDSKSVAQVAAVLGREFSLPILVALLESGARTIDPASTRQHLDVLAAAGLLRPVGPGLYAFKHALIRDAAYGSLWARDRRALHEKVVKLLRHRWPEVLENQPELLAWHLSEAGLRHEALAQWELAASQAAAGSAELEAISHLRRALKTLAELPSTPELQRTALRLQLLLAARLIATEGYGASAVLEAYREAQSLCELLGDETARFKVEMGLEGYRFMRADFVPALEHGRRAAAIAARSGDLKQRLQAHWGLACTLFHQGELRATMREMDAALALYTPAMHPLFGIQDPGVMCMAYSAWGLWEMARPDAALARINHAVAIASASEHKFNQAVALAYGVSVELLRGETEAALARAEVCISVCDDAGFPVWLAITRCMRGRLLCEKQQFDAGLAEIRAGQALWLSTGALVSQPLMLSLRAEGLILAGQLLEAHACVDEALAIIALYQERQLEAELQRLAGELALLRGDNSQAEQRFKTAVALALRQHRFGFALRAATSLAQLWSTTGKTLQARRLLLPLLARWTEGLDTRDVSCALGLAQGLNQAMEQTSETAA